MFPCLHLRSFLYKSTLDNSNHTLSAWQLKKSVLQSETLKLFLQPSILCRYFFVSPVEIHCPALCIYQALKCACYLHSFPFPISSFAVICALPITRTPANSNFFRFPLKVLDIGSRLDSLLNKISWAAWKKFFELTLESSTI